MFWKSTLQRNTVPVLLLEEGTFAWVSRAGFAKVYNPCIFIFLYFYGLWNLKPSWGRCYDHNFLRFLLIFGEKNWRFSKKTPNVMIKFFHNLALFWVKNTNFFNWNSAPRIQGCQIFPGTIYQNGENIPNLPQLCQMYWNIPNGREIFQMAIKYTNFFHFKALQNVPKLEFWVWKYTIWQPCSRWPFNDSVHEIRFWNCARNLGGSAFSCVLKSGRPDWANFRLLAEYLLRDVNLKMMQKALILGYFLLGTVKVMD
jgi:hypothetical protein